MKFELNTLPRNCSSEQLIFEIKRVDALVGKEKLTAKDFNKYSKMRAQSVGKKFGGWKKALDVAGLVHKYSGINISNKMRRQSKGLSNEEILEEVKRIAIKLDQNYASQENVNSNSEIISASALIYRFGSWENGIKKAGLENSPGYRGKFNNEEYFENMLNVWTHYGRQPKYGEMKKPPSAISPKTYESHFGAWRKALEAFVERMNSDDGKPQPLTKTESKPQLRPEILKHVVTTEDRRGVSLGLRYKILNRDKFKCVKCGVSPATDHDCQLHIDHVIPFSKGGKTLIENLQTLCYKCNLGKSNRVVSS